MAKVKEETKKVTSKAKTTKKASSKPKKEVITNTVVTEDIDFNDNKKINHKLHFSYNKRMALLIILFIILLGCGLYFLFKSITLENEEKISYNEKSNIDYKVYLNKNDFYDKEYLEKDMLYVANLIKKVKVDFNYDFNINENYDLDFEYEIYTRLLISDKEGKNNYYDKEFPILKNKTKKLVNDNKLNINETIDIDYKYYNSIANKFRSTYAVDITSDLYVYMKINKVDTSGQSDIRNNSEVLTLVMPLSERSVNIKMDYHDINQNSYIISPKNVIIENLIYFSISMFSLVFSILAILKIINLVNLTKNKKNKYDKYIDKILREYDRLIVETSTMINVLDKEIIKVNSFNELVDVRDNLKLPINYYVVNNHHKSHFYIANNNIVYLYTVKDVDLGE